MASLDLNHVVDLLSFEKVRNWPIKAALLILDDSHTVEDLLEQVEELKFHLILKTVKVAQCHLEVNFSVFLKL